MFEIAKLLRRILPFIWELYKGYKRYERESNERKIRGNVNEAWDERFGKYDPENGADNPTNSGDDKP